MRDRLIVVGLVVSALLIVTTALSRETRLLMYGTVTWGAGAPAPSVKLRLLQGREQKVVIYTNPEGRYGFFDVPGRPSDYALEVWVGDRLLRTYKSQDMQTIPRGGRHDIQLQQ